MKISILKYPLKTLSYVIIPFLESTYKKYNQSIFNMINKNNSIADIILDDKYKDACYSIDEKFKNKMVNIATITISMTMIGGRRISQLKKTLKHKKSLETNIQPELESTNKITDKITDRFEDGLTTKKLKKRSRNLNSLGKDLIQIYFIRIDDELQKGDVKDEVDARDVKEEMDIYNLLEELRVSGHLIYSLLKSNFITNVHFMAIEPILEKRDFILALLEGLMLSSYKFDKYKTAKALELQNTKHTYHLENINFLTNKHFKTSKSSIIFNNEISRLESIVASVFLARDLVNEPANDNKFEKFNMMIRNFIKTKHIPVELEIWDKAKLNKMGMGLILGVGKGSNSKNAPCVLVIKYNPQPQNKQKENSSIYEKPEWVLLGKGMTFDTGGLDLKNPKNLLEMKSDISGAAAVISFLLGYASNNGEKCIYAICPFAENSISSSAIKPSDVLKAYDGRTVEVVDTDAEGRLILADVIAYTVKTYPTAKIIDLATLTGQADDISGKAFSCILSVNTETETSRLIKTSNKINEALVRLPLLEKELSKLESNVADLKNYSTKSSADIIMSSLFMKQFIKPHTKWIHIDIAGPAFNADEIIKYSSPEASGVGVRLLFEYFSK